MQKRQIKLLASVCLITLLGGCEAATNIQPLEVKAEIRETIDKAFPNTTFDRVSFDKSLGMIVGESGQTVLYFDKKAKHVFVGDVMNLEDRVNVTENRRKELASITALELKAFGKPSAAPRAPAAAPAPTKQAAAAPPATPANIDASTLPIENLVVSNEGAGQVLYVVSDYNCSYCSRLHKTLQNIEGVEIREIPVGFLNPQSTIKAASVLCDETPAAKAKEFFNGGGGTQLTTCSDGEERVEVNTAWMQAHGISGTPLMIKPSGEVLNGAQPIENIKAFLGIS